MPSHRGPGAVDTPLPIARHLARVALEDRPEPRTVCDPAAGDGRLLASVADLCSGSPTLFGADVDAATWHDGPLGRTPSAHFAHVDALGRPSSELWDAAPPCGVDLVVGNPPFLSQLARRSTRSDEQRRRVSRLDGAVRTLTDTAAAFLLQACDMLAPGGRVAMILPLSFLSTRDSAPVRQRVLETCRLSGIWVSDGSVFPGVDVETCAVVLDRCEDAPAAVRRWRGDTFEPVASVRVGRDELVAAPTWSHLVSDVLDRAPDIDLSGSEGRLGDIAGATAGFRDQFYGLVPLVVERCDRGAAGVDRVRVLTSGSIDPGCTLWGRRPARIAGRDLLAPVLDVQAVEPPRLASWVEARRVPKVLVATQTRVIEAVADPTGEHLPLTPVVSVEPAPDDLWRALAVLLAPPVSLWARRGFAGAALSPRSIKLSAQQVLQAPLPADRPAWQRAADDLEAAHQVERGGVAREAVLAAAATMCSAYGVGAEVHEWWRAQLPERR